MHLEVALKCVEEFLRQLRFTDAGLDTLDSIYVIANRERGGIALEGEDRKGYFQCVNNLVEAFQKSNSFSRRGLERLLQKTLLKAWNKEDGLKQLQEAAINEAVKWLKAALKAPPQSYLVYLSAVGLDPSCLPTKVGQLALLRNDTDTVAAMKEAVGMTFAGKHGDTAKDSVIQELTNYFHNKAIIQVEVQAGDDDNAEEKALATCRQSIDAINFFADLLESKGMKACVSLTGDGRKVVRPDEPGANVIMLISFREKYHASEESFSFAGKEIAEKRLVKSATGALKLLALPRLDSRKPYGLAEEAFARVSEILTKERPLPLEERILSAIRWAGRATVDTRNEEAFLLYMIALESLILGGKNEAELTFRLRLRAAHILGRTADARKRLLSRLGALYKLRSQIVHSGSFQVTEVEVLEARDYVKRALLTILHASPFRDMTSEEQLESWFEDRLLASADDEPGDN